MAPAYEYHNIYIARKEKINEKRNSDLVIQEYGWEEMGKKNSPINLLYL